jgi:excisionase family DNA binding protein
MHPIQQRTAGIPRYAPIPRAIEITGLGRSTIYKLAGQGKLRLIKAGGRTLVDMDHAMQWMATLPPANIAPAESFTAR